MLVNYGNDIRIAHETHDNGMKISGVCIGPHYFPKDLIIQLYRSIIIPCLNGKCVLKHDDREVNYIRFNGNLEELKNNSLLKGYYDCFCVGGTEDDYHIDYQDPRSGEIYNIYISDYIVIYPEELQIYSPEDFKKKFLY
ncbi:hypothetical protein [Eisenbergiella porci]|uniref:hypothetical protein n=1 Tax=Eisenbergiella porci TaxID=2652274 RepID=UPI002A7F9E16|nr:hypothetical protein [Eisenbergiella porci]